MACYGCDWVQIVSVKHARFCLSATSTGLDRRRDRFGLRRELRRVFDVIRRDLRGRRRHPTHDRIGHLKADGHLSRR